MWCVESSYVVWYELHKREWLLGICYDWHASLSSQGSHSSVSIAGTRKCKSYSAYKLRMNGSSGHYKYFFPFLRFFSAFFMIYFSDKDYYKKKSFNINVESMLKSLIVKSWIFLTSIVILIDAKSVSLFMCQIFYICCCINQCKKIFIQY